MRSLNMTIASKKRAIARQGNCPDWEADAWSVREIRTDRADAKGSMRRRAGNKISVGRRAAITRRNRRENCPAFLWTKKSACPITREALVEVVLASYHGICGSIGSMRLRALDFFAFGASYPKRAHAAGSIGIGLVRPVSRFTKLPEYFSDPVR